MSLEKLKPMVSQLTASEKTELVEYLKPGDSPRPPEENPTNGDLRKVVKEESVKSMVALILALCLSPISIFLTLWITDALKHPELQIIEARILKRYEDIELSAEALRYLREDKYVQNKAEKYTDFKTHLSLAGDKLKLSAATSLVGQADKIISEIKADTKTLAANVDLLKQPEFDPKDLTNIEDLHFSALRFQMALQNDPATYPKIVANEVIAQQDTLRRQETRLKSLGTIFENLKKEVSLVKDPGNYSASVAVMNSGEVPSAILSSSSRIKLGGDYYKVLVKAETSFSSSNYVVLPANSMVVLTLEIDRTVHKSIPSLEQLAAHFHSVELHTPDGPLPHSLDL